MRMSRPSRSSCEIKSSDADIKPEMFAPAIDPVRSSTNAISSGVSAGRNVAASVDILTVGRPKRLIMEVGFVMLVLRLSSPVPKSFKSNPFRVSPSLSLKFILKASFAAFSKCFFRFHLI